LGKTWHAWERGEMHTEFLWENLKGRYHSEDLGAEQKLILQ